MSEFDNKNLKSKKNKFYNLAIHNFILLTNPTMSNLSQYWLWFDYELIDNDIRIKVRCLKRNYLNM